MKNLFLAPFRLIGFILQQANAIFFPKVTIDHVLRTSLEEAVLERASHLVEAERATASARNHRTLAAMHAKRIERLAAEMAALDAKRWPPAPKRPVREFEQTVEVLHEVR